MDDNEAYVRRLKEAGVETNYVCFPGMIHPFFTLGGVIEDTAKGIQRYGVADFPAEMRAIADAVAEAAAVLQKVMPFLDSVGKDHKTIAALCERVGQIEGRADASFDAGLTRLRAQLQAGEIDTIGYIDRKEIYELVEDVVDKCDDVANAVQTITAKHV